MNEARSIPGLMAAALAGSMLLAAESAAGGEIYRWVDADGGVHFSDTRPADETVAVATLDVAEFASSYDASEDPYSILNQAARTHERWQTIEAARRDRRQPQPPAVSLPANAPQSGSRYIGYGPIISLPTRIGNAASRDPARLARQQDRALHELELTGARPASINSSAHRARVARSQNLPLVTPTPRNR